MSITLHLSEGYKDEEQWAMSWSDEVESDPPVDGSMIQGIRCIRFDQTSIVFYFENDDALKAAKETTGWSEECDSATAEKSLRATFIGDHIESYHNPDIMLEAHHIRCFDQYGDARRVFFFKWEFIYE